MPPGKDHLNFGHSLIGASKVEGSATTSLEALSHIRIPIFLPENQVQSKSLRTTVNAEIHILGIIPGWVAYLNCSVKSPVALGVPLIIPVYHSGKPVGKAPAVTVSVRTTVCLYLIMKVAP